MISNNYLKSRNFLFLEVLNYGNYRTVTNCTASTCSGCSSYCVIVRQYSNCYATEQRHYRLLLHSKVPISNTTPRWRWHTVVILAIIVKLSKYKYFNNQVTSISVQFTPEHRIREPSAQGIENGILDAYVLLIVPQGHTLWKHAHISPKDNLPIRALLLPI